MLSAHSIVCGLGPGVWDVVSLGLLSISRNQLGALGNAIVFVSW